MSREHWERAAEEWNDMDLREKIAAVDPDHDREFLMDWVDWMKQKRAVGREFLERHIRKYLEVEFSDTWIDERAAELQGDEADAAYERSVDA